MRAFSGGHQQERQREREWMSERKGVPTSGATTAAALRETNLAAGCWTHRQPIGRPPEGRAFPAASLASAEPERGGKRVRGC